MRMQASEKVLFWHGENPPPQTICPKIETPEPDDKLPPGGEKPHEQWWYETTINTWWAHGHLAANFGQHIAIANQAAASVFVGMHKKGVSHSSSLLALNYM